ncbi:MAG: acyltransferase [Pseudomonadota bacterium]|nr:acyltransferase [Pseudomonadota bacterium]
MKEVSRLGGAPTGRRYVALDALRGLAVLLVVYDHLFAVAGETMAGGAFAPVAAVREWLAGPLVIIQDFGWFGVCLFFLISGFVITHSARRETLRVFVIRRALRIFPPLAATIVLLAILEPRFGIERPVVDYFYGVTLSGYFRVPQIVVLGVAWTLVIELLYYVLMALMMPLLRSDTPAAGVVLASWVPLFVVVSARDHGAVFFLLASSFSYVPLLLIGSVVYLHKNTDTRWWIVWPLAAANLAVFMMGVHDINVAFWAWQNSYLPSVVYAFVIFLICIDRSAPRALTFIGDMSYSLYLLHGVVGFALVALFKNQGLGNALPWLATLGSLVASYAMLRFVERPSITLGRRLSAAAEGLRRVQVTAQPRSAD